MNYSLPFIAADLTVTVGPLYDLSGHAPIPGTAIVKITSREISADVTGDDRHVVKRAFFSNPGGADQMLADTRATLFANIATVGALPYHTADAPNFDTFDGAEKYLLANAAQIVGDMQARMADAQKRVIEYLENLRSTKAYRAAEANLTAGRATIGVISPNRWNGDDLKSARENLGMTQETLAGELGCDKRTIIRYEKGDGEIPKSRVKAIRAMLADRASS